MTTIKELAPVEVQDGSEYEPTAEDKFLRVLYRLEHGEKLIQGVLTDGFNFCVVGLLQEESQLGEWQDIFYSKDVEDVFKYYGIRTFIQLKELPGNLCNEIIGSGYYSTNINKDREIYLHQINDYLMEKEYPNINEILIEVLQIARSK